MPFIPAIPARNETQQERKTCFVPVIPVRNSCKEFLQGIPDRKGTLHHTTQHNTMHIYAPLETHQKRARKQPTNGLAVGCGGRGARGTKSGERASNAWHVEPGTNSTGGSDIADHFFGSCSLGEQLHEKSPAKFLVRILQERSGILLNLFPMMTSLISSLLYSSIPDPEF